jgi:hypothetical protein
MKSEFLMMSLPFEMYLVAPNERHHEEDILPVL